MARHTGKRLRAYEQVAIGLSFTSDWSRKGREIFLPMTKRSKAKPKQDMNYFRRSIKNRSIKDDVEINGAYKRNIEKHYVGFDLLQNIKFTEMKC